MGQEVRKYYPSLFPDPVKPVWYTGREPWPQNREDLDLNASFFCMIWASAATLRSGSFIYKT